jgi:hypothetical protein
MVVAQQAGDADQGGVREHVSRQRRDRGPALDVGQRLCRRPGREHPRRAVEARGGQVVEQRVGGAPAGRDRPDHGVADADDQAPVGRAAGERLAGGAVG